ncbi:hypothetical protein BH18ACT1_BH18ACT1_01250 [soil metagenome]
MELVVLSRRLAFRLWEDARRPALFCQFDRMLETS